MELDLGVNTKKVVKIKVPGHVTGFGTAVLVDKVSGENGFRILPFGRIFRSMIDQIHRVAKYTREVIYCWLIYTLYWRKDTYFPARYQLKTVVYFQARSLCSLKRRWAILAGVERGM